MFFKRIFYFCSLICVLCFCFVVFLYFLVLFGTFWCLVFFLCFFVLVKSYHKKNKKFKTDLITSFILLLNLSYHNLFQLSQSFSIITIFFNYHNLFQSLQSFFQSLQSFSIITIFFNHYNLFFNHCNLFQLSESFLSQSFLISLQPVTPSL